MIEHMQKSVWKEMKAKWSLLTDARLQLSEEIEFIDKICYEIDDKLKHNSQSNVLANANQLLVAVGDIRAKKVESLERVHEVDVTLDTQLTPPWVEAEIRIDNYSLLRKEAKVVYSEPSERHGVIWRLKV